MSPISPETLLETIAEQQAEIIALKKLPAELSYAKLMKQYNNCSGIAEYLPSGEQLTGQVLANLIKQLKRGLQLIFR